MSAGGPTSIRIDRVAETGSTNADLLAGARDAAAAGTPFEPRVLVAERQTAGRGRLGRAWHATPRASLTFSIAWPFATVDLSGLSLAVGVVLAQAIDPRPSPARRVGLKWPNDLWLAAGGEPGRKLGGVLIETTPHGAGRIAVVGIGLNLLAQPVPEAASGVAWLAEIDAAASADGLLDRLVADLAAAFGRFERDGFAAFADGFAARDVLRGRCIRCEHPGDAVLEGIAAGVAASGELLVDTPNGERIRVGSGEVSVRLGDRPPQGAPERSPSELRC